jgi:hypothetical protein
MQFMSLTLTLRAVKLITPYFNMRIIYIFIFGGGIHGKKSEK